MWVKSIGVFRWGRKLESSRYSGLSVWPSLHLVRLFFFSGLASRALRCPKKGWIVEVDFVVSSCYVSYVCMNGTLLQLLSSLSGIGKISLRWMLTYQWRQSFGVTYVWLCGKCGRKEQIKCFHIKRGLLHLFSRVDCRCSFHKIGLSVYLLDMNIYILPTHIYVYLLLENGWRLPPTPLSQAIVWAWATTEPRLHEPRGVIWWREVGISVISSYHSVRSVIPTTDHNTWIEIVKNQHHYIISYFDWDPSGFGCRSIDHSVRPTNWKGIQGVWRDCTTIYQWHETKVTSLSLWTQIHWSKVNIWGVMWKFRVMWTPHPPPKTTVSTCVLWFGLSSSDLKDTGGQGSRGSLLGSAREKRHKARSCC